MLFAGAAPRPVIAALPRMPRQFQREQLLIAMADPRGASSVRAAAGVSSPEAGADATPRRTRPTTLATAAHCRRFS